MIKIFISALLLSLPAAAYSQELTRAELAAIPGMEGEADPEVLQRPEAQRIMSELSTYLRLSSKQEDRIGAAVRKKSSEFDKLMKEYERNAAEEKKWRFKANESRYNMLRINREIPDTVREFLDDEQREAYDGMLEAAKKPPAEASATAGPKPARKKVMVRRKKAPAPAAAEEAPGQVMVDSEPAAPAPRRKKVLKKKAPAPKPQPAPEPAPAPEPDYEEEAGAYP